MSISASEIDKGICIYYTEQQRAVLAEQLEQHPFVVVQVNEDEDTLVLLAQHGRPQTRLIGGVAAFSLNYEIHGWGGGRPSEFSGVEEREFVKPILDPVCFYFEAIKEEGLEQMSDGTDWTILSDQESLELVQEVVGIVHSYFGVEVK